MKLQANTTAKIASFFAATVITALTVGSQFGLAQHYAGGAGAPLAGQPAAGLVAMAPVQGTAH